MATLQSSVSQQQLISQKSGVKSQRQSKKKRKHYETTEMTMGVFIRGGISLIMYPLASAQAGHRVQVGLLGKRLSDGWIDGLELLLCHSAQQLQKWHLHLTKLHKWRLTSLVQNTHDETSFRQSCWVYASSQVAKPGRHLK